MGIGNIPSIEVLRVRKGVHSYLMEGRCGRKRPRPSEKMGCTALTTSFIDDMRCGIGLDQLIGKAYELCRAHPLEAQHVLCQAVTCDTAEQAREGQNHKSCTDWATKVSLVALLKFAKGVSLSDECFGALLNDGTWSTVDGQLDGLLLSVALNTTHDKYSQWVTTMVARAMLRVLWTQQSDDIQRSVCVVLGVLYTTVPALLQPLLNEASIGADNHTARTLIQLFTQSVCAEDTNVHSGGRLLGSSVVVYLRKHIRHRKVEKKQRRQKKIQSTKEGDIIRIITRHDGKSAHCARVVRRRAVSESSEEEGSSEVGSSEEEENRRKRKSKEIVKYISSVLSCRKVRENTCARAFSLVVGFTKSLKRREEEEDEEEEEEDQESGEEEEEVMLLHDSTEERSEVPSTSMWNVLPDELLDNILGFGGSTAAGRLSLASKQLRKSIGLSDLWQLWYTKEYASYVLCAHTKEEAAEAHKFHRLYVARSHARLLVTQYAQARKALGALCVTTKKRRGRASQSEQAHMICPVCQCFCVVKGGRQALEAHVTGHHGTTVKVKDVIKIVRKYNRSH